MDIFELWLMVTCLALIVLGLIVIGASEYRERQDDERARERSRRLVGGCFYRQEDRR